MTATAADALRMLTPSTPDTWPAGILAAADIRQGRAEAATAARWAIDPNRYTDEDDGEPYWDVDGPDGGWIAHVGYRADAEHIAAEGNPDHALAAVRHWRGTVERHRPIDGWQKPESACFGCRFNGPWTSCPELTEVADEARAYLGGSP